MKVAASMAASITGVGGTILLSPRFRYCFSCNSFLSLNRPTLRPIANSSFFTIHEPLLGKSRNHLRFRSITKAADSTPSTTVDKSLVPDDGGFTLAKVHKTLWKNFFQFNGLWCLNLFLVSCD